ERHRAASAREASNEGDRRDKSAEYHRGADIRRGLSADGADGGQSTTADALRSRQPRSRFVAGDRGRSVKGRRGRRLLRGGPRADEDRRSRAFWPRRSYDEGNGGLAHVAGANEARGPVAIQTLHQNAGSERSVGLSPVILRFA